MTNSFAHMGEAKMIFLIGSNITEAHPVAENQDGYRKSYAIYKKLYPALKPVYDAGAELGY